MPSPVQAIIDVNVKEWYYYTPAPSYCADGIFFVFLLSLFSPYLVSIPDCIYSPTAFKPKKQGYIMMIILNLKRCTPKIRQHHRILTQPNEYIHLPPSMTSACSA